MQVPSTDSIKNVLRVIANCKQETPPTLSNIKELGGLTNKLLREIYDYGRKCNYLKPRLYINEPNLIERFKAGIEYSFDFLDDEQQITAKIYRSGLQFLVDNFKLVAQDCPGASFESLENLEAVKDLDYKISHWGPYLGFEESPDLTGIPKSHYWWNLGDIVSDTDADSADDRFSRKQ